MSAWRKPVSWESGGCRDKVRLGEARYESSCPGKRACHFSEVNYCLCAHDDISKQELARGPFFPMQLVGTEALYRVLSFVDGEQRRLQAMGEEKYLKKLEEVAKVER